MTSIGQISYITGAVAFIVLGIALVSIWRGRLGPLLLLAVVATVVWALVLALHATIEGLMPLVFLLELLRDAAWLVFLSSLIMGRSESSFPSRLRLYVHGLWIGLLVLGLVLGWMYERTGSLWPGIVLHTGFNALNIVLALAATIPAEATQ